MSHAILYPAEAIAAQRRASEPAHYHNDMINQFGALEHAQDHHARAGFHIIMLYRPILAQHCGPTIMAGFGVFLIFFQRFDYQKGLLLSFNRRTGYGIF